ncbi:GTPase IMAP family member 7-like [Nematolebias whitei]|uniref:GTPase IMAP family member 7-like n=1 Tax=Nematolebias whitei TaxID=451745 RepID=UPI00189C200D|nr:GTPase IMAP family member 7-like [Nematolebias whitei]
MDRQPIPPGKHDQRVTKLSNRAHQCTSQAVVVNNNIALLAYSIAKRAYIIIKQEVVSDNFELSNFSVPNTLRIVLLGKTGSGKSSLANTIIGKEDFKVQCSTKIEATCCQTATRYFEKRRLTLTDTPGFFHPRWSEQQLKDEVVRCVSENTPGPHVFLIVLKVEKFTAQESQIIKKIEEYFSPDVFNYSVVVFTYGDQLEQMKIEEFVSKNNHLKDVLKKCGGRCHVVDNRHWKSNQQDEYRSNQFQVKQLINTIQLMVTQRPGDCYTMNMLKEWQRQQAVANIFECLKKFTRKKFVRIFFSVTVIVGVIVVWKRMTERTTAII